MIYENNIVNLKANLGEILGQKIIVKGSSGRSKPFEKEATIENTYPNHFIVRYENEPGNVSYPYVDVLTRAIELDIFDGKNYSPLLPPLEPKKKHKVV